MQENYFVESQSSRLPAIRFSSRNTCLMLLWAFLRSWRRATLCMKQTRTWRRSSRTSPLTRILCSRQIWDSSARRCSGECRICIFLRLANSSSNLTRADASSVPRARKYVRAAISLWHQTACISTANANTVLHVSITALSTPSVWSAKGTRRHATVILTFR